ncbi:MAG: hypothetical protein J2P37_02505 [Ktedonobacteraceae bacterium]|nr:hypothetical protein [Ktedonobacteraceae bacterium]MBO0791453.1 hypothetical protein [Ktedonobacteraceae bacterium]
MSERKPQTKYVPLRVRFRSPTEEPSGERDLLHAVRENLQSGIEPLVPDLSDFSDTQRRTQQIKELVRLSTLLRADLGLDTILQQFAASIAACTGFRVLVINLFDDQNNRTLRAAFAGLSEADQRKLRSKNFPADGFPRGLPVEFRISQSYFIPHDHVNCADPVITSSYDNYGPGGWHPEDMLIVPFYSPREQKMLGYLSLDDPEDGKRPTEESIEVAELFANQVAIAVDNARLLQAREDEHKALKTGIERLAEDLEALHADPAHPLERASHPSLQPIVDAINSVTGDIGSVLDSAQLVSHAVNEHHRNVLHNTELLTRDIDQRQRQTNQVAQTFNTFIEKMRRMADFADVLSVKVNEAVEVTEGAQLAVDRAFAGMQDVRDATIHSARTMKALSESSQEVNEAVGEITDLSMRLHLLALNAAIEASRVGEHGQGFAVIVKEMRTLAQCCTQAARKVSSYIRTFQHETSIASRSVEQSTQRVVTQTELVTQTGITLEAISKVTQEITVLVKRLCATVEGQEQGSLLVEQVIPEITSMMEIITLHTEEMQRSLQHLVDLTDVLAQRITSLKRSER